MAFKHIIGKSTFKYGFTIPKKYHTFLEVPEKGDRRKVELLYGENQKILVWLYRAKNSIGSLQVRYDGKYGKPFKNWVRETFIKSWNSTKANINEYFEVTIVNNTTFSIKDFPLVENTSLCFENILTHNIGEQSLFSDERFIEIVESIRSIQFQEHERQMFYNQEIKQELVKRGWLSEQKVVEDKKIRLKCDFRKEKFQLEVEFGNARTYYQDIVKFVMSRNVGLIKIGGLLVPSSAFAKHLCYLGHLNAVQKSKGKKFTYSGMMDFSKATIEFQYIKDVFNIPFFIVAVSYNC
jgi:hypothetical protein